MRLRVEWGVKSIYMLCDGALQRKLISFGFGFLCEQIEMHSIERQKLKSIEKLKQHFGRLKF